MNAEVQSIGSELKAAREAQGLTLEQIATRLHLMNRQVSAMESNDFAALGQPVYARGFVRNYARMLGLDAESMAARLDNAGLDEPQKIENLPLEQPRTLLTSPWVLGGLALLVVLIAIPTSLYVWLNSGEEPASVTRTPVKPITQAAAPLPAPTMPAPAARPMTLPKPAAPAEPIAPTEPPVPDNAVTIAPIKPASPAPSNSDQDESGAPATRSNIKLYFDEDAWVEVSEDSGRVLFHKLGVAGSSVSLNGTPPFSFVIGNAAHVRMTYNGRPLDLTPYIDVKVARFNLEE